MKIAVLWWSPSVPPGGASQAIRGNVCGFDSAGHDVHLYYREHITELEERAHEYDIVFSPLLYSDDYGNLSNYEDTHLHVQIGGYGSHKKKLDRFVEVAEAADTISCLDPNPVLNHFNQADTGVDIHVIPNAPNIDLFAESPEWADKGFVLVPKIGSDHKTGNILATIASKCDVVTFETHVRDMETVHQSLEVEMPGNVKMRPPVPFTQMQRRYDECSIVMSSSERETLPNVAFEAFITGKPYVCTMSSIGMIQTLPIIDTSDFGTSVDWFMQQYESEFYSGKHAAVIGNTSIMDECIHYLMRNREERAEMAQRGKAWVSKNFSEYSWKTKAQKIIELVESM